ncbi:MAG TPA: alpha/beta fold hydrolase [Rhodanobacteraceae bacterium]
MSGHIILSHGSGSSPEASKVSALARVAEQLGWTTERPDYRDSDALGLAESVAPRVQQLVARMQASVTPPLLVGSSMGAFVSCLASLKAPCAGLFLMALPMPPADSAKAFDLDRRVPAMCVHGYADDVCPPQPTLDFARERGVPCLLVADGHRLADHLDTVIGQFRLFLERYALEQLVA